MPRVSVCIACLNMAGWLEIALRSVFAQTYRDFCVVVRDDGSTEDVKAVCDKFDVRYLRNEVNIGSSQTYNILIQDCETELFFPFAADDILDPPAIQMMVNEFDKDPELEFCAIQTKTFIDVDGHPVIPNCGHPLTLIPFATNRSQMEWLNTFYQTNLYFGPGMYKTATLREIGPWDTSIKYVADLEMYVRLVKRHNLRVVEEDLCMTRVHDKNYSLIIGAEEIKKLYAGYDEIRRRHFHLAEAA